MPAKASVYIYGLLDPLTAELRYVGKSTNPAKRLEMHLFVATTNGRWRRDAYKDRWIRQLVAAGLQPNITILEVTDQKHWSAVERGWIARMTAMGARLTNVTAGGEGIDAPRTPEWRARIGAAHRGKVATPEQREKNRVATLAHNAAGCKKGHPWTPESVSIIRKGDSTYRSCLICRRANSTERRRVRGRPVKAPRGCSPPKTHCKQGHPLDGDSLMLRQRKFGDRVIEVRECYVCKLDRECVYKRQKRMAA